MDKRLVFLACTGLGRINRGYETFTHECFQALKGEPALDLYLFKGGGTSSQREKTLFNIHRQSPLGNLLGKLFKKESYFIEEFTFCLSFLPYIIIRKPATIFYCDFNLGSFLWNFRERLGSKLGLKYKLVFANGAPNGPPFTRCDLVQQQLPCYVKEALDAGEPAEKHFLLPPGINIDSDVAYSNEDKGALRKKFGVPPNRKVIISVGAVKAIHKRMDYLVREVSSLPQGEYFLVILGQFEPGTTEIQELAQKLLPGNHLITSVPFHQVGSYYALADLFVLCSLREGVPRVYLEALRSGLPVLTHDYQVSREALQEEGICADLSKEGTLTKLIESISKNEAIFSDEAAQRRRDFVRETYSWSVLKKRYVQMLTGVTP
jgi:1,2-diacylglycerol 3-alpha-glucosyltransferase